MSSTTLARRSDGTRASGWLAAVQRITRALRHAAFGLERLGELAAPQACGGCGLRHERLCEPCRVGFERRLAQPAFGWVERPLPGSPPCWAHLVYEGAVTRMLPAFKDDDRVDLLPPLAAAVRAAVEGVFDQEPALQRALHTGRLVVVCAPSTAASVRLRGRLPLRDLVRRALEGSSMQVAPPGALRFGRAVRDQAGLGVTQRARNLSGSMRATDVQGRLCLLLDDVITSGATLAEASRALRVAGADDVVALTAAAAVLRRR